MVKVAILHEGNEKKTHDNELLKLLITKLNLDLNRVTFIGMGNKSNFFKKEFIKYKRLQQHIQREAIEKVLFVIDADYEQNDSRYGGYNNTKKEIQKIIKELKLENYSDIYITCDPLEQCGYLESLILSSIPIKQKECIEIFLECSEFKSKENHKAILNQIYKIAYPNAPFDFSHSNFDELKTKLKKLFEEEI
jgi:hypothetical protein